MSFSGQRKTGFSAIAALVRQPAVIFIYFFAYARVDCLPVYSGNILSTSKVVDYCLLVLLQD